LLLREIVAGHLTAARRNWLAQTSFPCRKYLARGGRTVRNPWRRLGPRRWRRAALCSCRVALLRAGTSAPDPPPPRAR